MLELVIPSDINEGWDEIKGEFVYEELNKPKTIMLEHSLVSLSKWESLWKKRYFPVENRTIDEIVSYIQCMTITKNVEPEVYDRLIHHQDLINRITEYINDPMTATTFGKNQNDNSTRTENISSELIYFWCSIMVFQGMRKVAFKQINHTYKSMQCKKRLWQEDESVRNNATV